MVGVAAPRTKSPCKRTLLPSCPSVPDLLTTFILCTPLRLPQGMGKAAEIHSAVWIHCGSEHWPVPGWVVPRCCLAVLPSERIHHGVPSGSVPTVSPLPLQNSSLSVPVSPSLPLASSPVPTLQHPALQLLPFADFVSFLSG